MTRTPSLKAESRTSFIVVQCRPDEVKALRDAIHAATETKTAVTVAYDRDRVKAWESATMHAERWRWLSDFQRAMELGARRLSKLARP